ncbi:hypothetical protein Ddc_14599 [Ditylenchus destructor]|nr:hypothetical protein Ddc_14599 [Ditylenchus destructor]
MQKVWEWVRDKRRSTVRKWNSTTGFGRENGALLKSGDFDQFVAVASNPALTFGSTQNVDTGVGLETNGNAQKHRKNARTSSQSARGVSGPSPVPIPRKGKSLKNQTERKSDARSSDQQQLLQVPTHHREGSFRKLKRRLTPNFKKKTQQNMCPQADPEYEAELMQSSTMTTPLIICPDPEPNVAGGQSMDSLSNVSSASERWQKQPKALGDDNPQEGMRLFLIEDDSSQMCGINNAFGSSEGDNLSRSDLDGSENRSSLGIPSSIAVEPPSSGASINTEDEDGEPFIQLEPPVDQLSVDQQIEVAKSDENLAESQGQSESNFDCKVVTDVIPAHMSHSFTAPALKSAIPLPVGSMSVKTTRRKLRFMVPQSKLFIRTYQIFSTVFLGFSTSSANFPILGILRIFPHLGQLQTGHLQTFPL